MKLVSASIENFRLLKDVEFDFARERDRNLTVIRAANESGKTTLLAALQWALFGDEGLPDKGRAYRLSPIDSSSSDQVKVRVSVEVVYEVELRAGTQQYRLTRFVDEIVRGGEYNRGSASVALSRIGKNGEEPIENPESKIRPYLPKELREVFFTDGDRALSFIEGARGDQMKRVEAAIKSLLGLNVVEDALGHVKQVGSNLNSRIRKEAGNVKELEDLSSQIGTLEQEIPDLRGKQEHAAEERINLEGYEQEADHQLQEALKRGNKEELLKEKEKIKKDWDRAEKDAKQAARDHANLFKSEVLGKQLLQDKFQKAKRILDDLHDQGRIPNQTIPVLEDRLKQPACICGESLKEADPGGLDRREHIQHLIDASRNADVVQEKVSALYYSAQDLLRPVEGKGWNEEYAQVFSRRQRANARLREAGEAEREMDAKIAKCKDIDITKLKETRDRYKQQARLAQRDETQKLSEIQQKERQLQDLRGKRKRALEKDQKGWKISAELEVASDLENVLNNALETMKTREIKKVSEEMNKLFLEMIGADQSQRAVIKRAEVTGDFRITVHGQYDHSLDPSQDLNGASRRALTLAFILALTRVSEVEAPNVIDTPLGMMSGYVKRSVLYNAAKESSQLVLFLTHSEINGCEDILDNNAGKVFTLTNPAHYPAILANDPGVNDDRILICECMHREHCQICERRDDVQFQEATVGNE